MVVAPMLNGGRMENRWQPMSQLTWCGPSSRSTSFKAVKIGRSGQPVQKDGGRPCTCATASSITAAAPGSIAAARPGSRCGATCSRNARTPCSTTPPVYSPAIGSTSLPCTRVATSALRNMLLTACSMKSGWPSSTSRTARLPAQNRTSSASTSG
jgi:hypothetical protein